MITIKRIDILSSTRKEWLKFHSFRRQFYHECDPDLPLIADLSEEAFLKSDITNPEVKMHYFFVYNDEDIVGTFNFSFFLESSKSFKGNEKVVIFDIKVLRKYNGLGIGTRALQMMVQVCENESKSIFISKYQSFLLKPFFKTIGGIIAQKNSESRLYLSDINIQMIEGWIKEAEELNADTRILVLEKPIPDDLVEAYVNSFNESVQQMPKDEMESSAKVFDVNILRRNEQMDKEAGATHINVISIEKDGKVSGISILFKVPGSPDILFQGLTGVPLAYRGRNLGKWIKSKMILYIKDKYPEVRAIQTGNADSNAPMLYINNKLGFKKYKESITGQVSLEQLKKYLQRKNINPFPVFN